MSHITSRSTSTHMARVSAGVGHQQGRRMSDIERIVWGAMFAVAVYVVGQLLSKFLIVASCHPAKGGSRSALQRAAGRQWP